MTHFDIVMKLVGNVQPYGDSAIDEHRLRNMKILTELVDRLLLEIYQASTSADRHEYSMAKIGKHAKDFLEDIKKAT